jgi:urease accessory protein
VSAAQSTSVRRQWIASLRLAFARSAGRTRLALREHRGSLRVQRLFHPDADGKAHCYLLHPPGGVVLGDELDLDVRVDSGSALLTTPSAGRFYGVGDFHEPQWQRTRLYCSAGARLEWLPQETILFSGANARLHTRIDLDHGAALAWWDIMVLGRPATGQPFVQGRCEQRVSISIGDRLAFREQLALAAGDRFSASRAGLGGHSCLGILLLTSTVSAAVLTDWLNAVNGAPNDGPFSVTQRGDFIVARYLGDAAIACREGFSRLWRACSTDAAGMPAEPRIWHT